LAADTSPESVDAANDRRSRRPPQHRADRRLLYDAVEVESPLTAARTEFRVAGHRKLAAAPSRGNESRPRTDRPRREIGSGATHRGRPVRRRRRPDAADAQRAQQRIEIHVVPGQFQIDRPGRRCQIAGGGRTATCDDTGQAGQVHPAFVDLDRRIQVRDDEPIPVERIAAQAQARVQARERSGQRALDAEHARHRRRLGDQTEHARDITASGEPQVGARFVDEKGDTAIRLKTPLRRCQAEGRQRHRPAVEYHTAAEGGYPSDLSGL
jgi:hypothetical protein